MSAGTALKKINARAKALKKKHPGKKYKTLQKQAGAEYRAGKLKAKRKPAKRKAAKKTTTRRKTTRRKTTRRKVGKAQTVVYSLGKLIKRKRRKSPKKKRTSRRVGKGGSSMMPLIIIGGLAAAAYFLFKPATPPVLYQTSNPIRNSSANNILLYASAAGMTAKAIADLINAINNSSDADVAAAGGNGPGSVDLTKLRPSAGSINI